MTLKNMFEVESFAFETCMMAQFGGEGEEGDHLATHGMSLKLGDDPAELVGHIYMEKGDCSFEDKLMRMIAEVREGGGGVKGLLVCEGGCQGAA